MDTNTVQSFLWPPNYTIKKNPRARHVRLKVTPRCGLEIVVPLRFNERSIPEILEKNKIWIEKHLPKAHEPQVLPDKIILSAIDQVWKIDYIKTSSVKVKMILRPHQELVLIGDVENKTICKKILTHWVREQAQKYLSLQLRATSE